MDQNDLERRFHYHPVNTPERRAAHEQVRGMCLALAKELNTLLPEGREKSLAMTTLETAMFWGNAALARTPDE